MGQAGSGHRLSLAEACALLAGQGFQDVRALARDVNGTWLGLAVKEQAVEVWVDANGNIGARPLLSPALARTE